jgi:hypothetical protein
MTGLFEVETSAGDTARAMQEAIRQWRVVGKLIGPAFEQALLDQAYAVDLAKAARRATQISGANRTLYELLDAFHLLGDAPPPVTDPFQAFLDAVNDDGATAGTGGA